MRLYALALASFFTPLVVVIALSSRTEPRTGGNGESTATSVLERRKITREESNKVDSSIEVSPSTESNLLDKSRHDRQIDEARRLAAARGKQITKDIEMSFRISELTDKRQEANDREKKNEQHSRIVQLKARNRALVQRIQRVLDEIERNARQEKKMRFELRDERDRAGDQYVAGRISHRIWKARLKALDEKKRHFNAHQEKQKADLTRRLELIKKQQVKLRTEARSEGVRI